MANISLPFTFLPRTLFTSAKINANLQEISDKFNTYSVQTDVPKTITVGHTWTAAQSFTGGLTSKVSNTASGVTASLANGAGSAILSPASLGSGIYLLVSKASATNANYGYALVTYDTTTNAVTCSVLASSGITLAASGVVVNLTNATGGTTTFAYAYLRLL